MSGELNWEQVFRYDDPDLCYETSEFVVERNALTGQYRYGDDGGCSCYDGFDPANFTGTYSFAAVAGAFTGWASGLHNTAAAQEAFRSTIRELHFANLQATMERAFESAHGDLRGTEAFEFSGLHPRERIAKAKFTRVTAAPE